MGKDNRIQKLIQEKTGARADVEWLTWQTSDEKIDSMIKEQEYPDFLNGSDATGKLLEAGAYIPLEGYLDDYPNLKNYLTDEQWESLKQKDGHIYFIPPFGVYHGKDMAVIPSGEAFWIQKRVLKWANYPKIVTLDDYFDLIRRYMKENPQTDGEKNIGFEILCEDWRYFCLENPPMFLAGYPNDGCCVVDTKTKKVSVYDTLPEAKQYYSKLSQEYDRGIIDPECFTMSYEQYLEKLASGNVLGMVDQHWQFTSAEQILANEKRTDRMYVPLPITANPSIKGAYLSKTGLNGAKGIGITKDCKDVRAALKFMDDLLDPEIVVLRNWGEKGIDYEVDEKGVFYRTEEQRKKAADKDWKKRNRCPYTYFPHYDGMLKDGINTVIPDEQVGEFQATLNREDRKLLKAYGYDRWIDFLGEQEEIEPWYPLYSVTGQWGNDTDYGKAKEEMDKIKKKWLPQVIIAPYRDFEKEWNGYMSEYRDKVNVKAYEQELEKAVKAAVDTAEGK